MCGGAGKVNAAKYLTKLTQPVDGYYYYEDANVVNN